MDLGEVSGVMASWKISSSPSLGCKSWLDRGVWNAAMSSIVEGFLDDAPSLKLPLTLALACSRVIAGAIGDAQGTLAYGRKLQELSFAGKSNNECFELGLTLFQELKRRPPLSTQRSFLFQTSIRRR